MGFQIYRILWLCILFVETKNVVGVQGSYPYIAGNTFKAAADHIVDSTLSFTLNRVRKGDVIYVDSDCWDYFFANIHGQIIVPYILVTHNTGPRADESRPGAYERYLDDPQLIAWFSTNVEKCKHPKLVSMPIGIANREYPHGNVNVLHNAIRTKERIPRDRLLYINMCDRTPERCLVRELLKNQSFCTSVQSPKSFVDYLLDLAKHTFVVSPHGNGIDCHRTWEALLMGCIPIVKTSDLDVLYENLPVLIVTEWEEITKEFLEEKYALMSKRTYDLRSLYARYWMEKIAATKLLLQCNK